MKQVFAGICLSFSMMGHTQNTNDSLSVVLARLKNDRAGLETKTGQLRIMAVEKMRLLEKKGGEYDDLLVKLDSIVGLRLKIEKLKTPSSLQIKQLNSVKVQQETMKNQLVNILELRMRVQSEFDSLLVELDQAILQLQQLENQIGKLEAVKEEKS